MGIIMGFGFYVQIYRNIKNNIWSKNLEVGPYETGQTIMHLPHKNEDVNSIPAPTWKVGYGGVSL